jgi:transposase
MRPCGSQEELAKRRQLAMKLLKQGLKAQQVADVLGVKATTIYYWKSKVKKHGPKVLEAAPHPARESALTPPMRVKLQNLLLQGPQAHGYMDQMWTLERIAKVILKAFGIKFHPSWVWVIMQQMGWSCQKPQRIPREQNPKAVKEFRTKVWPKLKQQASRGGKEGHFH